MKRRIISIDEEKCTGCGQCIPDCPEGALQIIEGKARLVSDPACDGLGACIGTCPEGAISVVERDAAPYDAKMVIATIVKQGTSVVRAHLEHLAGHGQTDLYNLAIEYLIENGIPIPDHIPPAQRKPARHSTKHTSVRFGEGIRQTVQHNRRPFHACPGSATMNFDRTDTEENKLRQPAKSVTASELRHWPVQLTLQNPNAPYFDNADLLISADCVPFACPGFHAGILKGKILSIFCPKLDSDIDGYIEKLAEIFTRHPVKSITVARMEVSCCGGVRFVVDKALEKAGKEIAVEEITVSIQGGIL
jgi:NAD-dependent dihydropyrimidine dehydrogenase PreA subunit